MKSPLIIDRPDLQVWQQKAMFGVLTAAFWFGWVLLWLPLITLLGWLFFGIRFHFHMVDMDGYKGFLGLLAMYCLVVGVMGGALIVWAMYNHYRFRGLDRRREAAPPSSVDMGRQIDRHFSNPSAAIEAWRDHAIVTVHHDDQGHITQVTPTAIAAHTPSFDALWNDSIAQGNSFQRSQWDRRATPRAAPKTGKTPSQNPG